MNKLTIVFWNWCFSRVCNTRNTKHLEIKSWKGNFVFRIAKLYFYRWINPWKFSYEKVPSTFLHSMNVLTNGFSCDYQSNNSVPLDWSFHFIAFHLLATFWREMLEANKSFSVQSCQPKLFNRHAPRQVFVALNPSEEIQVGWMDGWILQWRHFTIYCNPSNSWCKMLHWKKGFQRIQVIVLILNWKQDTIRTRVNHSVMNPLYWWFHTKTFFICYSCFLHPA